MTIGERISEILKSKGMTQAEFCQKTGIPQSTVCDWKRKKKCPSADKVMGICTVLEITPYELLQGTTEMRNNEKQDYIVVSEGTEGYELLVEYYKLSMKNKERVIGYMASLSQ